VAARPADYAWGTIVVGAIIYELCADDLLSDGTRRYCTRYPILTRIVIAAIAGHLACALPSSIDVFSAKNIVHRTLTAHYPRTRKGTP
jgi:hypothetical protein